MGLWVELHCDVRREGSTPGLRPICEGNAGEHPGTMFSNAADGRRMAARVKEFARTAGYTRLKDGRWCCPGCKEAT